MSREKKILLIIVFNLIIIIAEISFGLISNSFSLIADALHNTGDVLAVLITYIALRVATKTASFKLTFGYIRAEMMAAFINTSFLYLTMIYMIYEATFRFFNPEIIDPLYMIFVGIIAVIANGISAYILNSLGVEHSHNHSHGVHHHSHEHNHNHGHEVKDANIHSAYLHMLSDALISVAVVIAGIFIYFFEIYKIDSILTIVFSIYILYHSYELLKTSFLSLMDINTSSITKSQIDEIIINENILSYYDLHIHKPNTKYTFISFCLILRNENLNLSQINAIKNTLKKELEVLGFNHILIEIGNQNEQHNSIHCVLK